jgi:adenosine kinase
MRRQVDECKKWGLRLCYDIGQQVSNLPGDEMAEGVKAAEILILNEYEMTVLAGKTGISIKDIKQQVPVVITTLGKEGSIVEGKSVPEAIKVGIAKPNQVADPTGAGDAFRSGFLYGYSRGWPLKACTQLGAVCGTYAIETMGTQAHTFTFEEVAARYQTSFNEALPTTKE